MCCCVAGHSREIQSKCLQTNQETQTRLDRVAPTRPYNGRQYLTGSSSWHYSLSVTWKLKEDREQQNPSFRDQVVCCGAFPSATETRKLFRTSRIRSMIDQSINFCGDLISFIRLHVVSRLRDMMTSLYIPFDCCRSRALAAHRWTSFRTYDGIKKLRRPGFGSVLSPRAFSGLP
jgi:hypothetical protein